MHLAPPASRFQVRDAGDCYGEDSEWKLGVDNFFKAVNWDALASIASRCRGAASCHYTNGFSVGQFNMVRRLVFDDGASWVVRLRLPQEATPASLKRYDSRRAFQVEIASIKFFKSKSTVPVPEVFAYDMGSSNEAGTPYMFLEYIYGTTAEELRGRRNSDPGLYGTAEQDLKFRDQMARIQAQVLSFEFDKIGSLYLSEETGFSIGPHVDSGRGPWKTAADYYRDMEGAALCKLAASPIQRVKDSPSGFSLPVLLNRLMEIYGEEREGPFRLVNTDFGVHNLLVDDDCMLVSSELSSLRGVKRT